MARDLATVKVCAFDMFGTLFDVYSVVRACQDAFGAEGEEFNRTWRRKHLEYSWLRALMGRYVPFFELLQNSLDATLVRFGRAGDHALRQRLLESYKVVRPFQDAAGALDALAKTGLKRVILTNGSRDMLTSVLNEAGFADKFDALFSVADVATFKPHPMVYEMAQVRLGVAREEILMVSAHQWDLAGAISYGFQGVWVDRPGGGGERENLGFPPDYRITGLDGLAALLSKDQA